MSSPPLVDPAVRGERRKKSEERKAFLFLTVVTWPLLAFLVVATYGLLVWIYQIFAGPPGPMR